MYLRHCHEHYSVTAFRKLRAAYNKFINELFGYARCDSMSGSVFQQPTLLCITLMFCLLVIAHLYHVIRSFSGLQTLLCGNFIFCGFSLFLVCFGMFFSFYSMDCGLK